MSYGHDVVLKCFVSGGSPPFTYKWNRIRGSAHPYRASSYQSQDTFQSEFSYDESFSSISQGEGTRGEGKIGTLGPAGASLVHQWRQVKHKTAVGDPSCEPVPEAAMEGRGGKRGESVESSMVIKKCYVGARIDIAIITIPILQTNAK